MRAIFLGPLDHELCDRAAESQSRVDVAAKVNTGPEPRLAGFEVSGPDGVPLMPQNPFNVEIRLVDSEEIQTDFEVEEPDGSISQVH